MANVYIGTNLQLKDKNFTRNLKKIADDSKAQTDKIKNNFLSIGTALKGMFAAAGAVGVGKLFSEVSASLKQTERSVGALRAITSSAEDARAKFQELNDLSRKIPQEFDAITAAAITLGKNGLSTSAANIEALAKISRGTNTSLESLAQALSSASMGQLKGLRQMGIIAKQEGDEISLTFQGTTEKIKANTKDLQDYIGRLAETKFKDTLKPEMEGITGAAKTLGEAWGDFTRELGESGLGDIIKDMMQTATKALDGFTQSIKTGFLGEIVQNIKSTWTGIRDTLKNLFDDLSKAAESTSELMDAFFENAGDGILAKLSHVIKLAALGFRKLYGYIQGAFGALNALGEHIGSTLQQAMSGGTERTLLNAELQQAYKTMIGNRMASMSEAEKAAIFERLRMTEKEWQSLSDNAKTANDLRNLAQMIGVTEQSLNAAKKKAEQNRVKVPDSGQNAWDDMVQRFTDANAKADEVIKAVAEADLKAKAEREAALEALKNKTDKPEETDGKPIGIPTGTGGKGGAGAAQHDTWTSYYQKFLDTQAKTLSKAEQIEYEYRAKIKELDATFSANAGASQEQYNAVKLGIEKNYQDARKALEKEAFDFMQQLRGDETYYIQNDYAQKLELLAQYHDQKLISEQDYLEQEKALRDAYYAEDAEYQKKKRQEKFDKQHEPYLQQAAALGQLAQAFSGLTSSMDESSGAYRALFAVQKGFAVASATMNAIVAWMNAFANGGPWPANLAAYGQAIAMTTSILAELSSIKAYDKGGYIPAGSVGLVGEIGPELISGPASVTSRRDTAKMMSGGDITINLVEDASRAGQVSKEKTDEGEIINIIVSNIRSGGGVSDAIGTAYGLSRRGQ